MTKTENTGFWRGLLKKFARANGGNIAMMFGLSLIPLSIAAGAGLDLARAVMVRQSMADALDAAALAVGGTPNISQANAENLAKQYFNANYSQDAKSYGTPASPTVKIVGNSVTLSVSNNVPTTLLSAANINTVPVTVSSTVVWGQSKLWVALVLDNSGSMCQPASSPCVNTTNTLAKIYQLKSASHTLLTKLQGAAANPGDVQVAIVPFTRVINYGTTNSGTSNVSASWLSWTLFDAQPANTGLNGTTDLQGPGDTCPFTTSSNRQMSPYGYYCVANATNGASTVSSIPSSGLICPGIDSGNYNTDRNDRYYNGCYTSVATGSTKLVDSGKNSTCDGYNNCSCSGSSSSSSRKCYANYYKHTWVSNAHSTWSGCITDRDQDYDIKNTTPSGASGFPADNPSNCIDAQVTSLGYNWTTLSNQIDAMQADGSTNQAIGVAHGWQTLTPGNPYGAPTVPANTTRYIILLSDGLNTQDRWYGDGGTEGTSDDDKIDTRMNLACSAAKSDGITIYTLFVHTSTSGNSAPLQNCATDSTKYFDLTSASQITAAFNQIAQQITNLRVSQ